MERKHKGRKGRTKGRKKGKKRQKGRKGRTKGKKQKGEKKRREDGRKIIKDRMTQRRWKATCTCYYQIVIVLLVF
jgi:hypothetical protein